jgi:hypothetical protein
MELETFKDRDPATLEKKKKYVQMAKEAANRWTGDFFTFFKLLLTKKKTIFLYYNLIAILNL